MKDKLENQRIDIEACCGGCADEPEPQEIRPLVVNKKSTTKTTSSIGAGYHVKKLLKELRKIHKLVLPILFISNIFSIYNFLYMVHFVV